MGEATKIKFLWVFNIEILVKPNSARTEGGHFEMNFLNDEARVGNSGVLKVWYFCSVSKLVKKFSLWLFFPGLYHPGS